MHIVWDQVPRWRKEVNDRKGKKIGERSKRNNGLGATLSSSIPRSVSARPVIRDL